MKVKAQVNELVYLNLRFQRHTNDCLILIVEKDSNLFYSPDALRRNVFPVDECGMSKVRVRNRQISIVKHKSIPE
jgi:hypothetical protein